jgi:hypothetical protein
MSFRNAVWLAVVSISLATGAVAQTSSSGSQNAPTSSGGSDSQQPPLAGANSFTESQAKSRIEDHGYTQVGELRKDDKSIWHARATKDGKPVEVQLDFKGNVVEAK